MGPVAKKSDPPLVDLKITNPITYIKLWWKKVIQNEGIDFRFHIRPLTAIAITVIVASLAFGVGKFVLPFTVPFFEYKGDEIVPIPTPEIWKETAYNGTLQYSSATTRYYLLTTSAEAITLDVPANINLTSLIGRRIFAAGNYNKTTRVLVVAEASDLEVLPKNPVPIPTTSPSPTPAPEVNP